MQRSSLLSFVAVALVVMLGCRDPGATGPARTPVEEPAAPSQPTEPAPPPARTPVGLGWIAVPGARDSAVVRHTEEGLAHHHAGRYQAALTSFERALTIAPAHAEARYGRARALARLGSEEAAQELERLLLEDLPTFGPRWADDAELASAHATAAGQRLDARVPEIRAAYREAIAAGVPAMIYRARPPRDAGGRPQIPQEGLRLGVYDAQARRFVPAVPAVPQALGGYLDREADRALVVAGELVMGEIWLVQARNVDVSVFDLADPGRVVLQAQDVDARHDRTDQIRIAVQAAVEGDDARVTLQQLGYDPAGTLSVRVTVDAVRLAREPVSRSSPRVHVDASGAFVDVPPPAGMWLDESALRVAGRRLPIALPPGHVLPSPWTPPAYSPAHPHVERTPDRRTALVFTELAGCREVAYASHVLDRVDLASGEVERLSEAPVHAGVALGPDGSVYLDVDGRVVRFPPGSTTPQDDVLPGVRFALPTYDRDCSV